ncbi:hypothetical protein IV203_002390 [Nitzschia inconspicua]|uniref:Uncharacterized protein n=1 Tax=Nitzschia inconspicua TaxID=303405 RepID=A0A9K3PS72_9STRA|nr:hypothetical protein IV203_002390 [Nitzschia inconspicua]
MEDVAPLIRNLSGLITFTIREAFVEHDLYHPEPPNDGHTPAFRLEDIRNIAAIHHHGFAFSPRAHPTEHINFYINSISSHDITPEEHALGNLTRRKLKTLTTLDKRHSASHKQLDQIASLAMFGEPGLIGSINFDSMVNAVPATAAMVPAARLLLYMPWPQPLVSCVEKPVQCLFYALAARLGYRTYGGDAQDAFAPSPGPIVLGASIIAEQQSKRSEASVARRKSERTMIQIPLWPPDKTADKTVPQHLQQETRDLTAVVIRSSISSLDGHDKGTSVRDFRNTASKRQR